MFIGALGFLVCAAGCIGGPKEAKDPRQLLGEDLNQGGVESSAATSPRPDPQTPPSAQRKPPPEILARRADCERAARHVQALGIDLAIDAETDPARKKKMTDQKADVLASPEMQQHIQRAAGQCLQRGTSRREARCIAKIQTGQDIDRCVH